MGMSWMSMLVMLFWLVQVVPLVEAPSLTGSVVMLLLVFAVVLRGELWVVV